MKLPTSHAATADPIGVDGAISRRLQGGIFIMPGTRAMPQVLKTFAVIGVLTWTTGCTISQSAGGKPSIKWRIGETIINSLFGVDDDHERPGWDPDPSWHRGYGFNNPNPERIRNGQPVLNFDGSVYQP